MSGSLTDRVIHARISTLTESCAQYFRQFLDRGRSSGTFDPNNPFDGNLDLKQFLAQFYYRSRNEDFARQPCVAIFLFVASLITIVAICIVQPPLPPPHRG